MGHGAWGMGHWEEDKGTRRIGDKGKDLLQVLTDVTLSPASPTPPAPLPPAPFPRVQLMVPSAVIARI